MDFENKVLGAIWGHILGDSLGVPYEFKKKDRMPSVIEWTEYGSHDRPSGTFSDDSSMILCTMASLTENKGKFKPWKISYIIVVPVKYAVKEWKYNLVGNFFIVS